jgi:peroxiredoxin
MNLTKTFDAILGLPIAVSVFATAWLTTADRVRADCPDLTSQTPKTKARARSAAEVASEEYQNLLRAYEISSRSFATELTNTALTHEERLKRVQSLGPDARFSPRFLALAEKYPEIETSVDCLCWCLEHADPMIPPGAEVYHRAVERVLRDHLASEAVLTYVKSLSRVGRGEAGPAIMKSQDELLRGLIEGSPHREVRGFACFVLAEGHAYLSENIAFIRSASLAKRQRLESVMGKEVFADRLRRDPTQLKNEAKNLFKRVRDEFGDILADEVRPGLRPRQVPLGILATRYLDELSNLAIGMAVPEFESVDLDGNKVRLSDLRGKVVVLDIWATWCLPCRKMTPHLRSLVDRLKGQPFVLVSISVDAERATLKNFIQTESMPWSHWHDPEGRHVLEAWNILHLPTVFVLDSEGVIRHRNISGDALDTAVDELLTKAKRGPEPKPGEASKHSRPQESR